MSIWEAVEEQDLDAIEAYVRRGGDLDIGATRLGGKTPLLHALKSKTRKSYSKLLAMGADPNTINRGGGAIVPPNSSVMHHAALEEDPFWLKAALEAGGDPDQMNGAKSVQKGRPLYFSIMHERVENVKLLCEHGADIDAPMGGLGLTALFQAAAGSKFAIVHHLLERGADIAEPRPVHMHNTFIFTMRQKTPDVEYYTADPLTGSWCIAVWEWLRDHGKDPEKAKWTGSKWTWDGDG